MKITELLEGRGSGIETWPVTNMMGHVKNFRKIDGWWEHPTEVQRWMKSHDIPQSREDKAEERRRQREWDDIDRQERREQREKAAAAKKARTDYNAIVAAGEEAIGNAFPDGDPIDHFGPWLEKRGLDMSDADAAFKKIHKKGFYDYLADMWDDHAADRIHDAQHHGTHGDDYSGEWFAGDNPWRSS